MVPINVLEKFDLIQEHWHPHIIGELNGQHVKIAKIQGDFVWHAHEAEDELFYVIKGKLNLEFRDKLVTLLPGEMVVVPRGVEHRPFAEEETYIMMFEPVGTRNTGDTGGERTVLDLPEI
ncbi:MAG: cupin domain-containing protein [Bacteroidota bacterium]